MILCMVIWLIIGLRKLGTVPNGLGSTFTVSAIIGISLLLSLGTGKAIYHWEIHETRAFVSRVIPKLEKYKNKHGAYPTTITDIDIKHELNSHVSYYSDTDFFEFTYWDSSSFMSGYSFTSTTRKWINFD